MNVTTPNPSVYAFDAIAAADAREDLIFDRDDLLNDTVSKAVKSSTHPAVGAARQELTVHRQVARWGVIAAALVIATLILLEILTPLPGAWLMFSAVGVVFVTFYAFTTGLSLNPGIQHLGPTRRSALHEYARSRGISIDSFNLAFVDADLLGGWAGQDGFHVRTDRLHPDMSSTQELLDQWAADDAEAE